MKNYKHTTKWFQVGLFALLVAFVGVTALAVPEASAQVATGFTFNNNLTIGSTGPDVVQLQSYLEGQGHLVMPVGVAKGYFGPITRSALARYQAANGITPAVGYFGPITRNHVNLRIGVVVALPLGCTSTAGYSPITGVKCDSVVNNNLPAGCTSTVGYSPTTGTKCDSGSTSGGSTGGSNSGLSGGEASLEDFDASSGDDSDVEENDEADIADFEFDVEDADAMIDRIDVSFQAATSEEDPWDTFENVAIVVDGKVIADEDVEDEDAWSDDESELDTAGDDYSIRFTGLDWTVEEGETAEFTVRVTTQNGVDDLPATWTVGIGDEGIRATDGEGIDSYIGDGADVVTFDVEEAGQDEELTITEADDNPESNTLQIESNSSSDWEEILAFDIEAEESDIEITELPVLLTFTGSEDYGDVINDIKLEIDGEEYDDVTVLSDTNSTTTVTFEFDNEELVIDADSTVTARLWVRFNSGDTIDNGDTVVASIRSEDTDAIEAEGADDLDASALSGSVDGNTFTLRENGVSVTEGSSAAKVIVTSQDAADGGDYGTYTIKFKVTAFEEDAWVPLTAAASGLVGADFHVTGSGASSTATTTASLEVESGVTKENSRAKVPQGQTKEFTLSVVINAATDGFYGLELQEVAFATTSTATADEYTVPDEDEFEVDDTFISAN